MAAVALATWMHPTFLGPVLIRWCLLLILLEFIVVHSAAFMGNVAYSTQPRRLRIRGTLALGGLYSLFAAGFAFAFGTWWPLLSFWGLTLNRLAGVLSRQAARGREKALVQHGWAAGALVYLLGGATAAALPVPRFGIDAAAVAAARIPGTGQWVDEPHRAVAFTAFYFAVMGTSQLFEHRWISRSQAG